MALAKAYIFFVLAAWLLSGSLTAYAIGRSRGLFWDEVNREKNPAYFWTCWSVWSALGVAALVGCAWRIRLVLARTRDENLAEMSQLDPWTIFNVALVTLCLGFLVHRHIRIGDLRPYVKYLKERYEQRRRLRALITEEETGIEGVNFDAFVEIANDEWVEEIIEHLRAQPAATRSLKQAIQATET